MLSVGTSLGLCDGTRETLGWVDGLRLGWNDGDEVGSTDGSMEYVGGKLKVGEVLGIFSNSIEGCVLGETLKLGKDDGDKVELGILDAYKLGMMLGDIEGSDVVLGVSDGAMIPAQTQHAS